MRWLAMLGLMVAAALAAPGAAAGPRHSVCAAASNLSESLQTVVSATARWRCTPAAATLAPERTLLLLPVAGGAAPPTHFTTRTARFEAITIGVVRDGRILAERRYLAPQLIAHGYGSRFQIPLPAAAGPADAVLAVFDRPTSAGLFASAALVDERPGQDRARLRALLLAALICGMLLMPLAFNAAHYRVVRERFMLWHLVVTGTLLIQCLLNSGILSQFVAMPVPLHAALGTLSFGCGVAAAAAFGASFIEPGKLNPRLRRWLYLAAAQVMAATVLHAAFPFALRTVQTPIYYLSFVPALVLFCAVLVDAVRRRSRAVRYQLIAWAPFILVGVIRIVTMVVPGLVHNDAMPLFYLAMVVQSVATSLGVADRFMGIKRQRDRAVTRARSLERLSERDDLTGLYNRRALDGRLGDFDRQRFTGFALFDLDHFKRVNDTHGHAVGDAVIKTVAGVLGGASEAVAVRLGGEEFLLLLHGVRVAERVERLREAIPVRIAREVAELETLVTASAGLIEAAPTGHVGSDFVALYRLADDLLYEAKHNGRNLLAAVQLERAGPSAAAA